VRSQRQSGAGHTGKALLFLLAVLAGAASPVTAELVGPSVALASAADLAEAADHSGYPGVIVDGGEPLSRAHLARALLRRAHLSGEQRAELDVILTSAAPPAQLYLTRAFAAGHPVGELARFATLLARRDRSWLRTRLQLIDAAGAGPVRFGVTELLNRQAGGLGVRYRWIAVARTLPSLADAVLRRSLAAVEQGYPVPMLIGDLIPRHYVLLVGHDPEGALYYEPSAGELVRVPAAEVERHDFRRLGFRHLYGAILPGGPVTG
jgi:hypothetical protein